MYLLHQGMWLRAVLRDAMCRCAVIKIKQPLSVTMLQGGGCIGANKGESGWHCDVVGILYRLPAFLTGVH